MKIISVIGARPQFIKAAVVSRALGSIHGLEEILLHTGQHFDAEMSQIFFDEMEIPQPRFNLGIGGGTHGQNTGRMIEAIEGVLLQEKPDWVMVYGDTDSTLAGALAAAKLQIPLAHVEAGLRSYNRSMPEEINRVLTDHAAQVLFVPNSQAVENLALEGIAGEKVRQVGDVMYDAALFYGQKAESRSGVLRRLGLTLGKYVLATIHRPENTDDVGRMSGIMRAFQELAAEMPVVFPVHPRTRQKLGEAGPLATGSTSARPGAPCLIPPVGYLDMVMLEKNAAVIATDSGGVQREAFFHRVPCVILRKETEWVELVELGWSTLAQALDPTDTVTKIRYALSAPPGQNVFPYGKGDSAQKIARFYGDQV
ncbi:MAG: UDP-N-acetylglucosamine 2-epimerase (non-hydrolyzing) [Proteobacteria bacterium]|nr:UDP-N-acetylglucosamine 2-epimerase (non-hydrolyzing) [Pseudomonadota bacterium]MBU4384635.1 UDP-N-acetylglucosamine 2-epimerase (non-hydrolyzing) [Pseudomonadota bacterium]MCG2766217.1 UDP-N-acetylglucosamine 2-epimerase (non-hydrolyzing) [Desulfarculaceae bacterium]